MGIENRNLLAGTRLVANYKKQTYVCTVGAGEGGEGVVFVLEDGTRHKSPSAAGSKVMGGKAVNGWRFWSVEGDTPTEAPAEKPVKAVTKEKSSKLIKRLPGTGLEDGQRRFFCSACQKSFVTTEADPQACPEGHSEKALAEFTRDQMEDAMGAAEEALDGQPAGGGGN